MEKKKFRGKVVNIDFDYLDQCLKRKGVTQDAASREMGMGSNFISTRKSFGNMRESHAKFLSLLYNLDYNKLIIKKEELKTTQEVKQDDESIQALMNLTTKLSERVAILESKIEHKDIKITEQEDIILLLNQMLKYGQCQESQFKSKAKSYNFSPELMEFAINELKLERDVSGEVVWLTKPKAKKAIREK